MSLLRIVCLLLSFLFVDIAVATPLENCILLGSKPSLIIKLNDQLSDTVAQNTLSSTTLAELSDVAQINFLASRAMAGGNYVVDFQSIEKYHGCYPQLFLNTIINQLQETENVESVEPNILLRVDTLPETLVFQIPTPSDNQWNLSTNTAAGGINAPTAWGITTGNPRAIVAVVDNGILNNDSLSPNLLSASAASFYNAGTVSIGASSQCSTCSNSSAPWHGTHTSGSVASSGNGAYLQFVYGVAYTARVLPVNVFTKFTSNFTCNSAGLVAPCLLGYESDLDNALAWLSDTATFPPLSTAPNIVAVNMSIGGVSSCSNVMQTAINALYTKNIAITVSAGNDNTNADQQQPANCDHVIAVSATGKTNQKANYSNYGAIVKIAAPGGSSGIGSYPYNIYSTREGGYIFAQGTSMAAPQVAGLVSLLYSVDPTMTPVRALQYIQSTATAFAIGTGDYYCDSNPAGQYCGAGIINAGAAVAAITPPTLNWTPHFVTTALSATSEQISWNAATWSNSATTTINYSVTLDSNAVSNCQNITATTCVVSGLTADIGSSAHSFTVTSTDYRQILTPASQSGTFNTVLVAPVLTSALRNQENLSEVWVEYSSLGSDLDGESYTLNGLPDDVTITLDAANQRFVLENVGEELISGVSITVSYGDLDPVTSNEISIPSVAFIAPTLSYAVRNQTLLTQAWIYYMDLGTINADNVYTVVGLPTGASVTVDTINKRFIINNISVPTAEQVSIQVSNATLGTAESLALRLPSIVG